MPPVSQPSSWAEALRIASRDSASRTSQLISPRSDGPVRPVGAHRVEAVRDDQEVRGERELLRGDPVVAAAVVALVVELDGARLGRREVEPAQETSGEPRRAPHRSPLGRRELARLAQDRGVDRDLTEVVEAGGPAEAGGFGGGG